MNGTTGAMEWINPWEDGWISTLWPAVPYTNIAQELKKTVEQPTKVRSFLLSKIAMRGKKERFI